MILTARLRDRLPSALIALGLQAGLLALLLLSFEVVRQPPEEKETILILPPLARPVLPAPMVIDGRGRKKAAIPPQQAVPEGAGPALPAPVQGAGTGAGAALPAPGQAMGDCAPQKYASLTADRRAACPPAVARQDNNEIPLHPDDHVKDEPYWEAERENSKAPVALPGAAGGPLGILLTALFDPGAFADKHNYSYGPPLPPKDGTPDPNAPPLHASDEAFKKALQAVNDRKHALYGAPPPAAAAQAGAAP